MRTYVEFADEKNRAMYDPETGDKGYPDENFDATKAMVINWHRNAENVSDLMWGCRVIMKKGKNTVFVGLLV